MTAFTLRNYSGPAVLRISTSLLAAGPALTLFATFTDSAVTAMAGTVASGIGYGAAGLGTFGSTARLAGPADSAERGELLSA